MLLKISEKIIRRNVLEQKKKKPSLNANQAFQQLRPVEHLLHGTFVGPVSLLFLLKLRRSFTEKWKKVFFFS